MAHRHTPAPGGALVAPARAALALSLALAPARAAHAQVTAVVDAGARADAAARTPPVPITRPMPAAVREQIVGYDPARGVLAFVEHSASGVGTFRHVSIVEVTRQGEVRRARLTTDLDATRANASRDGADFEAVYARVARDIEAARARFPQLSASIPVSHRGPASPAGCTNAPFQVREFNVGSELFARVAPSARGVGWSVALGQGARTSEPADLPTVTVTTNGVATAVPYNVVADVRELPGADVYAVLVRTDACMGPDAAVPARALLVPAPPPPEAPLAPMPHAELSEAAVVRAIAPGARRRVVDETAGWYEGRARIVFDNAWTVPADGGDERILVQYSRHEPDLPPPTAESGHAHARFAMVARDGRGRLRVLSQLVPPERENVFEGTGQEAFLADLDGDTRPEFVIRSRLRPDGEVTTVLQWLAGALNFVWRGATRLDERAAPMGATAEVRQCTMGTDRTTLVVRCTVETHRAGAPRDAAPVSRARVVQRLRWNGGALQIAEERR